MAFCGSCGAQVQDGIKFCQACGQPVASGQVVSAPPAQVVPVQTPPAQQVQLAAPPPVQPPVYPAQQQIYQPPVVPGAPQQADIRDAQDNKTMAILSYILFFIPLLTGAHKTSPFVKFHANQGTVLFLFSLGASVILGIISAILTAILTATLAWGAALAVASIFGIIWMVYGIGVAALCVVGIINAAGGKMKRLPLIGKINIIK